ncbi:hypothetical protein CC1G_03180 [Coprinopsis cinerea okayama7|uniref:Sc15 protein n=1 Tax=Coprinopsis cinerea (strain Okayama-7 / 130 / ATCC MYA-4618 / FGSC 9003) TaxID=240176 RepID=A8PF79_COPC7|nr:hypothetical protein CC1G_03180 [Coprinopsis cinerea okayama7\|eukprot:XP_001840951.1 hypothetical protein CC1G_03180 [Coprinopsis cinerea okayama7\
MFFTRVLLSVFAVGAISAVARPAETVQKREDVSDVLAVIGTLKSTTGSILPQLDALVNSDDATEENVSPLLEQLAGAFDTGTVSLQGLQGKVDPSSGGTEEEVAEEVATVYTDVATSLDNLKTKKPHLYPLVPKFGLDLALFKLLLGLQLVLAGVLKLVAVLLKAVGVLLHGLGFTLLVVLLGLL